MVAYVYEIAVNAYSTHGWSQFFTYRSEEPLSDTDLSYDGEIINLALEHDLIDEEDMGSITYTRRLEEDEGDLLKLNCEVYDCGPGQEEE